MCALPLRGAQPATSPSHNLFILIVIIMDMVVVLVIIVLVIIVLVIIVLKIVITNSFTSRAVHAMD
jgi:heme/copper-type cytochrome/quinol oxidase subunit 2